MYDDPCCFWWTHDWMTVRIPLSTGLRSGLLGSRMSCVKSAVLCHSSSVLLCTCGALESKSHQQLDRCMAATVWAARHHSNSPMHHELSPLAARKPHQCTRAWSHRLILKRRNMFVRKATRYVHELKWHLIEIWSENRHSFIDQSTDQWQDCFIACLKTKSKYSEHLLWCVSLWYVTVMTFKAYITAVINKLMYVSFHKVGWEQPSGDVDNFVAVLCKFTKVFLCAKNYEFIMRFDKVNAKNNKGAIFCLAA